MRKLSLLLTLLGLMGCRSPVEATQTVIKIRADDAMQQRIKTYTTQVFSLPQNEPVSPEVENEIRWPVKRTFVPESKSSNHRFRYVFRAFDDRHELVSTLDIETEVVPGASRYLYFLLSEDCLVTRCDAGVCKVQVSADSLRTSPDQAHALEGGCRGGSLAQPPVNTGTPPDMTGDDNAAGSGAPTGQNTNTTGTGPSNTPAADGGTTGTPTRDAGMPSTTEACSGNPCGQGDCILNAARTTGYECKCNVGLEPDEAGATCVPRDDCAKPDKGGCEDTCTTKPTTGEAECSCEGPNRWLKADQKQCAEVQPARELSTSGGSLSRTRPQVAFDRAGNGVVVWTERSAETGDSLWTARFRADTKQWEPAIRFMRFTNEAADLHLALDERGSGVVMWTATVSGKRQLWATRYRNGAFAPRATSVDADSEGDVVTPSLALDATGDGLAVWTDMMYPRSKLRVARYYASSDSFVELENVQESADRFVFGTSVAVNNLMGGLVAWTDMGMMTIPDAGSAPDFSKASARSSRVANGLDSGISFTSSGLSTSPDVVMDAQGNGIAVWLEASATSSSVFSVVSRSNVPGTDSTAQDAHTLSERGGPFSAPRVVIGADGTAFAAWRESVGSASSGTQPSNEPLQPFGAVRTANGYGRSYELGLPSSTASWNDIDMTAWTPETTVSLLDRLQPNWSTAVGPDQTGFIAGASFTSSVAPVPRELWLQRIGPDAEPAQLIALSDSDTVPGRPSPVELSLNANGDGAVVWDRQVDGLYHVFVNLLD